MVDRTLPETSALLRFPAYLAVLAAMALRYGSGIEDETKAKIKELGIENPPNPGRSNFYNSSDPDYGRGLKDNFENAFQHAYASAITTFDHGEVFAKDAGALQELITPAYLAKAIVDPDSHISSILRDVQRDLFNNRVGREIARYAMDQRLPRASLDRLVLDALNGGQLVVNQFEDLRVLGPFKRKEGGYAGPSTAAKGELKRLFGRDLKEDRPTPAKPQSGLRLRGESPLSKYAQAPARGQNRPSSPVPSTDPSRVLKSVVSVDVRETRPDRQQVAASIDAMRRSRVQPRNSHLLSRLLVNAGGPGRPVPARNAVAQVTRAGLRNSPAAVRAFSRAAGGLTSRVDPEKRIAEIERRMASDRDAYFADAAVQAEYLRLLEQRRANRAKAGRPAAARGLRVYG